MEKKVEIRADEPKQRLYILLSGFLTDEEIADGADKCIACASKLKPGFDAITDISEFKPASGAGIQHLMRAINFVKEHGVRRAVRISGEAALSEMQFDRVSKEAGFDQSIRITARSVAEAEKILDSK